MLKISKSICAGELQGIADMREYHKRVHQVVVLCREAVKRVRSKKPVGAPTRPKSAYMFFLGEFREKWKVCCDTIWSGPQNLAALTFR